MRNKLLKRGILIFLFQHFLAKGEPIIILEENPLLFINQGLGVNSEYNIKEGFSVGADIEIFRQNQYMSNGVVANRFIYTAAPKLRYYFLTNDIYGPFIGTKLDLTYSQTSISDLDTTATSNLFYVAPIIQIGYRFVVENGITISAYVGGGIKSSTNSFDQSRIPSSKGDNTDWQQAQNRLNKNVSKFQPDYGLTIGYIF